VKNFKLKKLPVMVIAILIIIATVITIRIHSNNSNNDLTKKPTDPSTSDNSGSSYYESLYGTWTITNHIPSNINTTLSDSIISLCIGQKFTIEKDEITSIYGTISNPTIKEEIMTASDFSHTYNDTFKNLGISGDKVKYIKITQPEKNNHSVTILIADDGKVYALLGGALFELKKE
jgi:hypothetical protein